MTIILKKQTKIEKYGNFMAPAQLISVISKNSATTITQYLVRRRSIRFKLFNFNLRRRRASHQ